MRRMGRCLVIRAKVHKNNSIMEGREVRVVVCKHLTDLFATTTIKASIQSL